jgi:hypothetical protein
MPIEGTGISWIDIILKEREEMGRLVYRYIFESTEITERPKAATWHVQMQRPAREFRKISTFVKTRKLTECLEALAANFGRDTKWCDSWRHLTQRTLFKLCWLNVTQRAHEKPRSCYSCIRIHLYCARMRAGRKLVLIDTTLQPNLKPEKPFQYPVCAI